MISALARNSLILPSGKDHLENFSLGQDCVNIGTHDKTCGYLDPAICNQEFQVVMVRNPSKGARNKPIFSSQCQCVYMYRATHP